jgi:hypothetical protein
MATTERRELLLSADDSTNANFKRACAQLRAEGGPSAMTDFAFKFGQNSFNWTGTEAALFEKTADQVGYLIDWHGADKEDEDE